MKTKKGTICLLSMILFSVCAFSFSACGKTSELEAAIKNSNFSNVIIEINYGAKAQIGTQAIDGEKVKITEGDAASYIEKDDGEYYLYSQLNGKWRKEEYTYFISRFGTAVFSFAYFLDFKASDFVKSEGGYSMTETARQEYCERVFIKQFKSFDAQANYSAEAEYLTLKTANGKISEFEMTGSMHIGEQPVQTITIKLLLSGYDTVKIELPEAEEVPLITSIQEQFKNFSYQTTALAENDLEAKMIRGFYATKFTDFVVVIEYEDELTAQNALNKFENLTEESMLKGRFVCYAKGNHQSAFSFFEDFFA